MCKHRQSLIFDVFIQNAFDLKVSWGHILIHYVAESLEMSSKCFKIAETILVVFVTLGSDERLDKIHTRPFRPNHWYKFFKSSYLRPLPAIFSAMLFFYWAIRMNWVVQLSSKGQESLMTVVKIFQVSGGILDRDYRTSVHQHFIRQSQPRRKQDSSKSDQVP